MDIQSATGNLTERRILVTGGTGFIGRPLVCALAAKNPASIAVLSRGSLLHERSDFESVVLDLADAASVSSWFHGREFDLVYHLAGVIDQSTRPGIYAEQLKCHVQATLNLVEALAGRVGRFVHVGSNAEYGAAPCPQAPNGPAWPNSAYGLSKHAASQLVLAKHCSENFPTVVARPFLVYGPGQGKKNVLGLALMAALGRRDFPTTLGRQTRDFTPLSKVVSELVELGFVPGVEGSAFNLCTGVELELREPLEMLQRVCPDFNPRFGDVPYRATELLHSSGVPFRSVTPDVVRQALLEFLQNVLSNPSILDSKL